MSAQHGNRREPAFNMPGLVVGTIGLLVLVHAIRQFLSPATDFAQLLDYGFIPAQWSVALDRLSASDVVNASSIGAGDNAAELGQALANLVLGPESDRHPWAPLTYAGLHVSWTHVVLNCVWLAAFATPVVRRCGTARGIALGIVTAFAGAVGHWLVHPAGITPLIGASAIVSGFMAAAATFVFDRDESFRLTGMTRLGRAVAVLARLARNRTAVIFLGSWFVLNLLSGFFTEPLGISEASIAWEAHLGGFLAGLLLFPLIDPARAEA